MDVREKLVELLTQVAVLGDYLDMRKVADHLIASGVVVSKMETATIATDNPVGDKWIPVTERLPDPFEIVYVYDQTGKRVTDAYMTRHKEWVGVCMNHEVTHWMPLPKPPKGE